MQKLKTNNLKLLGAYENGNYNVVIFSDGTKIRRTEDDEFIPSFSENCDVKITDKCSIGCNFCYEGCSAAGKHGNLLGEQTRRIINSLHPYTELAINGNDMDHPDLEEFLRLLRERKILTNITVHEQQLINNFEMIARLQREGLVHGIGISTTGNADAVRLSQQLKNTVFHTIAGVTEPEVYNMLAKNRAKVLVLGYKTLGRGVQWAVKFDQVLNERMKWLDENLERLSKECEVLSFDNLALSQLNVRRLLTDQQWEEFYMGDDGKFTFYIDLVKGTYSRNSLSKVRFKIENKTADEMFHHISAL